MQIESIQSDKFANMIFKRILDCAKIFAFSVLFSNILITNLQHFLNL